MAQIINGKRIAKIIRKKLKKKVEEFKKTKKITPGLAVILVGNNQASKIYVRLKEKACQEIGIHFEKYLFPRISQKKLIDLIQKLNKKRKIHGIIVQLPLPKYLNPDKIIEIIKPEKDVDGFHPENIKKLFQNKPFIVPPLIQSINKLLQSCPEDLKNKKAIIMANSKTFALPLKKILEKNQIKAEVYLQPPKSKKITAQKSQKADILITALGRPNFINQKMVKKNSIIIDAGFTRLKGKILGDVDLEKVKSKIKYISPVPGGVGPMTIAMLLTNLLKLAKKQSSKLP